MLCSLCFCSRLLPLSRPSHSSFLFPFTLNPPSYSAWGRQRSYDDLLCDVSAPVVNILLRAAHTKTHLAGLQCSLWEASGCFYGMCVWEYLVVLLVSVVRWGQPFHPSSISFPFRLSAITAQSAEQKHNCYTHLLSHSSSIQRYSDV